MITRACEALAKQDETFTGTIYAACKRMEGVHLQQIKNIDRGSSPPGNLRVQTAAEIIRVFDGVLTWEDFTG